MNNAKESYSPSASSLMLQAFQFVDEVIDGSSGQQLVSAREIRRLMNILYEHVPGELALLRKSNDPRTLQASKVETESRIAAYLQKIAGEMRFVGDDDRLKNARDYFKEALRGAINDAVSETRVRF